ncbi:MAG: 4-(cytidine 5'-diphospho)-2-C-methyl-D-erythritol kinase [Bryobacteraceae bacterium]|nr:4-(cytidine 5'-diphospho)-2-C-methyl-D-erythritol kinase [Bryobacteraceae bacterium]MDW8376693.1 4-(cytidine 5'-diphospho)-2-C-methyl-D-erythritol kinase [Bryobacterales bacterium]
MVRFRAVRVKALAKINLSLRVLHRRPDGYHELRTVFQTISLADEISLRFRAQARTTVCDESSLRLEGNLAVRAAQAVLEALGVCGEVRLNLRKRIPMGAGLGGGSSDAAAVLMALPFLLRRELPRETLAGLAAGLGSDVPYFLLGGTALGLSRGEELYPLPQLPSCYGLLLTPPIHVSTATAYQALCRDLELMSAQEYSLRSWGLSKQATLEQWAPFCTNDFEPAIFARHPELGHLHEKMRRAGAVIARMTGSGSAIYGLFASREAARQAARRFRETPHFLFRTINKPQYDRIWAKSFHA